MRHWNVRVYLDVALQLPIQLVDSMGDCNDNLLSNRLVGTAEFINIHYKGQSIPQIRL